MWAFVEPTKHRVELYKSLQSQQIDSQEYISKCKSHISELNADTHALTRIIKDLDSDVKPLRQGSIYLISHLVDVGKEDETDSLNLTDSQLCDIVSSLVSGLTVAKESREAGHLLWALRRSAIVSSNQIGEQLVTLLYACQRAVTDIKSPTLADKNSLSVAANVLQLITKLYRTQTACMNKNTKIWFSLVLSYCAHQENATFRTYSQQMIDLAYDHLTEERYRNEIRSILSDVSENVIANITYVLNDNKGKVSEEHKLFAIRLWGLLVIIMGSELENMYTTNLYLSAFCKAFSKSYPTRQAAAFKSWRILIETLSMPYLLQVGVLNQLSIPLTKSNRVEEPESLQARILCWWSLIQRLQSHGEIENRFIEICKPLLEFCLSTSVSANTLVNGVSRPTVGRTSSPQSNLLQRECLSFCLRFLGVPDHVFKSPCAHKDEGSEIIPLSDSAVKHSGRVLLQAVQESFIFLSKDETTKKRCFEALMKAYNTLISRIVQLLRTGTEDGEKNQQLLIQTFSLVINIRSAVSPAHVLDLVESIVQFSPVIMSSTAYTSRDKLCFMKCPAMCILEVLCDALKTFPDLERNDLRITSCITALLERGCGGSQPSIILSFVEKAVEKINLTVPDLLKNSEVAEGIIVCVFGLLKRFDVKENPFAVEGICDVYTQMARNLPQSSLLFYLNTTGEHLGLIFQSSSGTVSNMEYTWQLWQSVCRRINQVDQSVCNDVIRTKRFSDLALQTLSIDSLRVITVTLWRDRLSKTAGVSEELRTAMETHITPGQQRAGVKPSPNKKPPSARKLLALNSQSSRSPLSSVNKRQLISNPSSPVGQLASSPSRRRGKRKLPEPIIICDEDTTDSYNLLQGLITPEKRQKLSETTPDTTPTTKQTTPSSRKATPSTKHDTLTTKQDTPTTKQTTTKQLTPTVLGSGGKYRFKRTPSIISSGGKRKSGLSDLAGRSSSSDSSLTSASSKRSETPTRPVIDRHDLADAISQRIDSSPPQSQLISQTEEDTPLSQEIAVVDTDSDKKSASTSAAVTMRTPKQSKAGVRQKIPATPGYPLTSPQCLNDKSVSTSMLPDATPIKFRTPESDTKMADFIILTPCSVKLVREPIPLEQSFPSRERTNSEASSYSQSTICSIITLDSQSTIVDSQSQNDSFISNSESQSSVTDSHQNDSQLPQRRSRRSKVVKRLGDMDSASPSTRKKQLQLDSQSDCNLSQSSQSQQSQTSQTSTGTPRSMRTKKTIETTPMEYSALIEVEVSALSAFVCMVKNKKTHVIKCDGIKSVKPVRAGKISKVTKQYNTETKAISSQELHDSQMSQVIDISGSFGDSPDIDIIQSQPDAVLSSQSRSNKDSVKPKAKTKVQQILEPAQATGTKSSNENSSKCDNVKQSSKTSVDKSFSADTSSDAIKASMDIPELSENNVSCSGGQQDSDGLFDSISTHDSFFDEETSTVENMEVDKILKGTSLKDGGSLQFSSLESEVKSASSTQDYVTPIPPRLAASTPSESSLTTNSAKSSESADSIPSSNTDKQAASSIEVADRDTADKTQNDQPGGSENKTATSSSPQPNEAEVSKKRKRRQKNSPRIDDSNSELERSMTEMENTMKEVSNSANTSPIKPTTVRPQTGTVEKAARILLDEANEMGCSELDSSIEIPSDGPSLDYKDGDHEKTKSIHSNIKEKTCDESRQDVEASLPSEPAVVSDIPADDVEAKRLIEEAANDSDEIFEDVGMSQFDEEMEITESPISKSPKKTTSDVDRKNRNNTTDDCDPSTTHTSEPENATGNNSVINQPTEAVEKAPVSLSAPKESSLQKSDPVVFHKPAQDTDSSITVSNKDDVSDVEKSKVVPAAADHTSVLTNGTVTPVRLGKGKHGVSPSPNRMMVLSPSRAQKMLSMTSRGAQMLQKMRANKSPQVTSSPGGMSHVDTMPATPKSRKLNVEALELDCTPIYSPTTGSILKRKRVEGSPPDPNTLPKKVKFNLPEKDSAGSTPGLERKLQRKTKSTKDDAILAMYGGATTDPTVNGDKEQPIDATDDSQKGQSGSESANSQMTQPSQSQTSSQKEPPIASEYTASSTPIGDMVTHLAVGVWQGNLRQCLISQGITTVGDMAKLTESDIDLLPIKAPKLSTTLKAFKKSGATRNTPRPSSKGWNKSVSSASPSRKTANNNPDSTSNKPGGDVSAKHLEAIMKLVTDKEITNSQLGSEIRTLFGSEDRN